MSAQFFTNIDCLKASTRTLGTWIEPPSVGDKVVVIRKPEVHLTVIGRKWVDGFVRVELGAPANYVLDTIPAIEEFLRKEC